MDNEIDERYYVKVNELMQHRPELLPRPTKKIGNIPIISIDTGSVFDEY